MRNATLNSMGFSGLICLLVVQSLAAFPDRLRPSGAAKAQDCDCLSDFDYMVNKVQVNYAGYADKVTRRNQANFGARTRRLQRRASQATADTCASILREWLDFFKDGHLFVKTSEQTQGASLAQSRGPSIRIVSPEFLLLSIPSFEVQYKAALDRLLSDNWNVLLATPNLIIDIRGNVGGGDGTYSGIIPLLYTNPIITSAMGIWSSADNMKMYERFVNRKDPNSTPKWVLDLLGQMEKNKGVIVSDHIDQRLVLDTLHELPRTIAILTDRGNMSSAETFLLQARQSKKVILFGARTRGVVDYLNVNVIDLPCKQRGLLLGYPTSKRSLKLPQGAIDNIGISPDVPIDEKVVDKVGFIINYVRSKN